MATSGLFGETPAEPDDDGASLAPLLVTAVGSCLSVADMGRCVRSSLLHPAALAGGVQGHEKAPLAHKLPSTADPLRKILRCLDELAAFERDGGELPKLHAAVKEAHEVSDTARRAALLNALRVETDDAIQRCATKGAAEREKRTRTWPLRMVRRACNCIRCFLGWGIREDSVYCGSITRRTRTNAPPLMHPPSCTVDPGRT